jgi:molybdopterin-guanine dinucleotide biosynthesis protein MobB
MAHIPVFSVVAYSGTGKTTMLESLVRELKRRGLRVAAVKHDAHDFDIDKEGKDSWRFTRAGADVVAIASDTHAAVMENRKISFEKLIASVTDVDIILTEGYKTGPYPKIALRRAGAGLGFAVDLAECIAVMSDVPADVPGVLSFDLDDISGLADFLCGALTRAGD